MKKIIILGSLFLAQFATAGVCSQKKIEKKVYAAALNLETAHGGKPLTQQLYSLSSEYGAYLVIFSYSGVQNFWKVKMDYSQCQVVSVEKK